MPARRGAEPGGARCLGVVEPAIWIAKPMPKTQAEQQVELAGEQQLAQRGHDARRAARGGSAGAANIEWLKPGMFIMKMPSNAKPRSTSSAAMRSAAASGASASSAGESASALTWRRYANGGAAAWRRGRVMQKGHRSMFETAIAGSLPKPAWLAETEKLWPEWKSSGAELERAKADATLLWLKVQEDAGLDIVGDGEQSRQHFVHGFLAQVEGIDFEHKVKMGIRDNRYDAMVPQVVGAAAPERPRPRDRGAPGARAHRQRKLKFTLPGPMTIVDTVADRYYGDGKGPHQDGVRLRRAAQPGGARAAGRRRRHRPVRRAGVQRLHGRRRRVGRRRARARGRRG